MKEIINFVDVSSSKFCIENVRMRECVKKISYNGRQVGLEKIDECSFEFSDNYCNKIFTNRAAGNALFKAMKYGVAKVVDNSFESINNATDFLKSNGFDFRIGA